MKIDIHLQIKGAFASASSEDVWMKKIIDLPFNPYPGLIINDTHDDEIILKEVYYILAESKFKCYVESDHRIYNALAHGYTAENMYDIVSEYTKLGWKLDND